MNRYQVDTLPRQARVLTKQEIKVSKNITGKWVNSGKPLLSSFLTKFSTFLKANINV